MTKVNTNPQQGGRRKAASQELSSAPASGATLAPDADRLIRPLAQRAMFMRPERLCRSAWLEHIPFAFWLVEAHRPRTFVELGTDSGASFFAFCQAVERLGLGTSCFAVDTWKGDEHAGFYGEEVYEAVRAHNEARYARFARLVRSTFDEALDCFSDGSIDLLHIDGLHLYQAVRHDFESWLPKLSERAVVVFHDSNVRERQFGVWRLVEELKEQYPAFEFTFGHGLTVLGVGSEQTDLISRLFRAEKDGFARRTLHDVFGRLGRACVEAHAAEHRKVQLRDLRADLARKEREVARTREALEAARDELGKRTKELNDTRAKLRDETERRVSEGIQLSERISTMQELQTELKERIARVNSRLERASGDLQDQKAAVQAARESARKAAEVQERERSQQAARIEALEAERDAMKVDLEAERAARQKAEKEASGHARELTARAVEIAELTRLLRKAETSGRAKAGAAPERC